MALGQGYQQQNCSLARALEVVGERWTMLILRDSFFGVRRFSDFFAHLDIPKAVLTTRLQTLLEAGLMEKDGHDYLLTESGRELWPAVHTLARWGERLLSDGSPRRLFIHTTCRTRIDADGRCPTCGKLPTPEELEVHPGPGLRPNERDDAVAVALQKPRRLLTPIS